MISSRSDYRESKSIHHGGDSMITTMTTSGSKGVRHRVPAFMAMLFGAIFTILLLPAYGQQEVDPTWYDPWVAPSSVAPSSGGSSLAAPNTAVVPPSQPPATVHSSQPPVATHRDQQMARSVSSTPATGKLRGGDTQLDQSRHNAARKTGGTPSADSRLPGTPRRAVSETWDAASVFIGE
jgi:hypothetical protein